MKYLFIIIFFFSNKLFAQIDSTSSNFVEDTTKIEATKSMFKTIEGKTYYFNGKKNVMIYNKGKNFFKSTFYSDTKIKSNCKVKIVIAGECNLLEYAINDSMSNVTYNNYLDVIYDGLYKEYFENGKIKVVGKYSNGKKIGKWKTYDFHGNLKLMEFWDIDSKDNIVEFNRW